MTDTLYIIGNRGDLHHGLKTAYSDFRDNSVKKGSRLWYLLYDVYGDIITKDMWWSNFEEISGCIDYLNLIKSRNGEALGFMKVRNLLNGALPPLFGKWIKEMKRANSNISKADWKIYCHEEGERKALYDKLLQLGINKSSIKKPIKW